MPFSIKIQYIFFAIVAQFMIVNALPTHMPAMRHELFNTTSVVAVPLTARASGSACHPLTAQDVKGMPSWSKIEAYAFKQYGTGKYNLVTNPSTQDVNGSPAALVCAPSAPVPLKAVGTKNCATSNTGANGSVSGTTALVTVGQKVGVQASISMTVSKFSSYSSSYSFGVSLGIPDIGLGVSASTSFSTTVSNSQTQSVTSTINTMSETSIVFQNANHKTCTARIDTTSCQTTAAADIPLVATGVVWFEFDDKRAAKIGGDGFQHYKWSVSLEDALPDINDRTSILSLTGNFQGTSSSKSQSQYSAVCK